MFIYIAAYTETFKTIKSIVSDNWDLCTRIRTAFAR